MNPRRLAMAPTLTVVFAGCVATWVAGFVSAGIEGTAAAPIVDPPIAVAAATPLAAIHQIAVSRPSVATPNARVADAFSAIPLNVTTVLKNVRAALPDPVIEAKSDTRSSANAIVAAELSDAAPDAVVPSD